MSETDVPGYDATPRSIAVLKRAVQNLSKNMSLAEQARQITNWSRENARRWHDIYPVNVTRQRLWQFINTGPTYFPRERDLFFLAWHWFFERQRHVIAPLWLNAADHHPNLPNLVAPTLHSFLSPQNAAFDISTLEKLAGSYAVYRPSFVNLDDIMVMSMTCGVDDDPSRFEIAMSFFNDDHEEATEHVEGYAVPYQDCILFQGRLRETSAPFIFVMSSFPIDPRSGGYSRGDGTLLVGARGTLSSAYPITMRRAANPVVPQTYDAEAFRTAIPAHREIMRFLGRGVVGWR